jgi:integrase
LNEIKRYTEKEKYIFYSARAKENGHISGNTIIKALNTLGYDTGKTMSPHGFRGTFSTILHESTLYNTLIIESQLSHTDNDTSRSAYNHARYLQDRREMMQLWADYLDALRDGSTLTLRDWAKSRSPKDGGERAE